MEEEQTWQAFYNAIILDEALLPTQRRRFLDIYLELKKQDEKKMEVIKKSKQVLEQLQNLIGYMQKKEKQNENHIK
jgi:hypothetical protein